MSETNNSTVFIKDPEYAWLPATLTKTEGDKAYVSVPKYPNEQAICCDGGRGAKKPEERVINLKEYPHKVLPLQNVDANGCLVEHADMIHVSYLHEVSFYRWVARAVRARSQTDSRKTHFSIHRS